MPDYPVSDKDKFLFRHAIRKLDRMLMPKEKEEHSIKNFKNYLKNKGLDLKPEKTAHVDQRSASSLNRKPFIYLSDSYPETVESNSSLSYAQSGLSPKRFQNFLRENIYWEAKLDLHGLKLDLAKDNLIHFIFQQNALFHRYLLVIHGKGGQYTSAPVLKNLVNHWLRQFPQVLAFRSALARDGGNGAVYVLLKKNQML